MIKSIKIGPHIYTIKLVSAKEIGKITKKQIAREAKTGTHAFFFGIIYIDKTTIYINKEQNEQTLKETLLHECIHAIIDETGISDMFTGPQEERMAQNLGFMLLGLFKDNPKLVAYLMK